MRARSACWMAMGCLVWGLVWIGSAMAESTSKSGSSSGRATARKHRSTESDESDFDSIRRDISEVDNRRFTAPIRDRTKRKSSSTASKAKPTTTGKPKAKPLRSSSRPSSSRSTTPHGVNIMKAAARPGGAPKPGGPGHSVSRPAIFLDPPDAIVEPDVPFTVGLAVGNPTNEEFEELKVTLAYDPTVLRLVDTDSEKRGNQFNSGRQTLIDDFKWLAENPALYTDSYDTEAGQIEIVLQSPQGKSEVFAGNLAEFRFLPISGAAESAVWFVFEEEGGTEPLTFMRLKDEDILGKPSDPLDGTLDGSYRIAAVEEPVPASDQPVRRDFRTRIRFDPPQTVANLGERIDLDIVLDNPQNVPFDSLTLVLRYDTTKLKVMDYDQDNWIKEGVNIHDGDCISSFPFTEHLKNRVYPKRGIILYEAASPEESLRTEGVVAAIRFIAIQPTSEEGTTLDIGFHSVNQSLNSGIYYRGKDILADNEAPRDGFESFTAHVVRRAVSRTSY